MGIVAIVNHEGFQSIGTIKGSYRPKAEEPHKGTIKTEYGEFNALIHKKCRKKIRIEEELYFLVWLKYIKKEPRLTVIAFGEDGVDNEFFISAAWTGYKKIVGEKSQKYQLIAGRNSEYIEENAENRKKLKIKINCKGELPKEYFKKFIAIEGQLIDGILQIKTYKLLGETVPNADFIFEKPPKKQGKTHKEKKPKGLIKKKIEVGEIQKPKLKKRVE